MDASRTAMLVATLGGLGRAPKAPGTVGTLGAVPFAVALQYLGGPVLLCTATVALYLVGLWACNRVTRDSEQKDPGYIVVDEAVGVWIALVPAVLDWRLFVAGFLLFRLFDITKPWPVSWADRKVAGAQGVMLDDVLAGLMAVPFVVGLRVWVG